MTDGTAGTTSNHSPNSPSSPSLSSPTTSHSGRRRKRSSSSTSNRDETTPTPIPTTTTTPSSFYPLQGLPRRPRSQPAMATSVYQQNREVVGGKPAPPPSPLPLGDIDHDHDRLYPLPPPPPPKPRLRDDPAADPPPSRLSLRKRAASIDVEEANHHRMQSYGLYTPNTARADDGGPGGGPGEMICLCAKAPKVPRPRNAFILYRQHWQGYIASQNPGLANPDISKLIGEKWRAQPEKVKNEWKKLAEEEKIRHQRQYPDYRYQPRRGGKNASGRPTSASGEIPGRCPKCGGRYIATPRTPSTPFSVATPMLSNPSSNMQPYINPNPRVIETEHLRRGSASSGMSTDGHGRRYTQPHTRDFEEDYDTMSPMTAAPDMKRRRYNGPQVFIPGSPPMGYMPVDPRYPQRPSVSGPPLSATGYGPGPLPRPPMPYRQPGHPNHPSHPQQMQPPPRPSISYQPIKTPTRPTPGFDESLRLPPLQTQVPNSPTIHPEAGHARAMSAVQPNHPTGLGIVNNGGTPIRQQQQQQQQQQQAPPPPPPQPQQVVPTRWPFLLKLEVLRSISPPLKPPGPGGPVFETRGPIIAVEGAAAPLLKEVAAVVEKALSVSGEYAVKLWSDENNTLHPGSSSSSGSGEDVGRRSHQHNNSVGSSGSGISSKSTDGKPENNINNTVAGPQSGKKPPSLLSPIAHYMARMLRWHKVSEDLIRYVTTYAPPPPSPSSSAAENSGNSNNDNNNNNSGAKPEPAKLLPVAVLADGYSLSYSDRYAGALHVNDAYRADDHWQWVATLWRGIVGADLTVYVKRDGGGAVVGSPSSSSFTTAAEKNSNSCVEFVNPAVLVLRVGAAGLDEKVERRLGFEIMEWVRGGSFQAGFGGSR
ncbi:hypothetical protein F4775DRAFT_588996 [Biscogniauxia sp. FL1348]|nr:hypothetical protein F4775DRAFT_588996 [Biscogniauxia sp. FL1348]